MRRRARRIVVLLIVLILAAGGWLLGRSLWEQRKHDLAARAIELLPQAAHWVRDFRRSRVVDGKKVWEVAAREAQYYDNNKGEPGQPPLAEGKALVVVRGPYLSFYTKDDREFSLRGEEGRVYLDKRDIERVELRGGIEMKVDEYSLRTDTARYSRAEDVISTPGRVEIRGGDFELAGDRLMIDVSRRRLSLDGNVHMTLVPPPA